MKEIAIDFLDREKMVWGPLFILCTIALSATAIPVELLCASVLGLYLAARWHVRGAIYSVVFLSIISVVRHLLVPAHPLWQLGLETSLGLAFLITGFGFEQGVSFTRSLQEKIDVSQSSLTHLEEELSKTKESALLQQIGNQEKILSLQKELEDLQTDHSSLLILNEVLRKQTARCIQESEQSARALSDQKNEMDFLKQELEMARKDLEWVSNHEGLAIQNRELFAELNAARLAKEQTHLINETLARLYYRESLRAKEAQQETASFADQLVAARKEAERIAEPLQERLNQAQREIQTLNIQFEKVVQQAQAGQSAFAQLQEISQERNFLKERLQAAELEIAHLQKAPPVPIQQEPHLAEQLQFARDQMARLSQMEPMLKQLRKQFEEKNQLLHQTRSELFQTDTQLQGLKIEKAALELQPVPKEVEEELERLAAQLIALEDENLELHELVSTLFDSLNDPMSRKKKVKMQSTAVSDPSNSFEQKLLF